MSINSSETDEGIAKAIVRSVIDFQREPWPKVSENAKDLVRRMLDPNPSSRLTAKGVLGTYLFPSLNEDMYRTLYVITYCFYCFSYEEHPWMQHASKAPNIPLGEAVRSRLKQLSVMNKFKKKAMRVIPNLHDRILDCVCLPCREKHS